MKMRIIAAASVALLGACGGHSGEPAPGARVQLVGADGGARGSAVLFVGTNGTLIRVSATGLPAGVHGFHIHAAGKCEPPFQTAGGHFNPGGKKHGSLNPDGPHAGDLTNLTVDANGTARVDQLAGDVTLESLFDSDSSALVIHESADDYKTDPSGNSGARIACGVIRRPQH